MPGKNIYGKMNSIRRPIMHAARTVLTLVLLLGTMTGCYAGKNEAKPEKAKYIFLFIGDGMGASNVAAAESYLSYKKGEIGGEHLSFTGFPVFGMATTYSANRHITCSSAAGTAISCGEKTNNGYLCVDPEGNRMESFTYKLKKEGYRIGIMSTVPINHATPAAFYGHNMSRDAYYSISQEIPQSGFDFFAGDGFLDFNGKDGNLEDTDIMIEAGGYTVCYGDSEYEQKKDSIRIILCQADNRKSDSKDYVVKETADEDFSLAEMLDVAVSRFGESGKPFFIMAEEGGVDWAGHSNLTMPLTEKVIELDDAVRRAYAFYVKHPDETLIIVTADHETGGITLGCGNSSMIKWELLENGAPAPEGNIGWSSTGHTGAPVPVFAVGKGAEEFTGWYDNTDISAKIMD